MASHDDKVHYEAHANVCLVAFADPESYQWAASRRQVEELAAALDRYTPASTLLSLFRDEATSLLAGEHDGPATFAGLVSPHDNHIAGSTALTLQLGLYILFSKRFHATLHTAGTFTSGVNRAAVVSYGLGKLAAAALGHSCTLLDLVKNSVAAVEYALLVENSVRPDGHLSSLALKLGGEKDEAQRFLAEWDSLAVTATHSLDEVVLTGDKAVIDALCERLDEGLSCALAWTPLPTGVLCYTPTADDARLHAWPFDTPSSSRGSVVDLPGTASMDSKTSLFDHLVRQDGKGAEELWTVGKLIHAAIDADTSVPDVVAGLVDVVCVGPMDSFAVTTTARLHQVDARVRSVDLAGMLFAASAYTDIDALPIEYSRVNHHPQTHIAVVGYSLRVPGASDPAAFWALLEEGRDMHSEIPKHLFDLDDYHNVQYRVKNTMRTRHGNFLDKPGHFDARLFGVTREQAEQMDPQHRNAFLAAYEALEMSGHSPFSSRGRAGKTDSVGVFVGGAGDDYREGCSWHIQPGFVAGNSRQAVSAGISDFFGFHGPSHTYDTACSSSLVAVEAACQNIINGRCASAIAGGVSVLTQPQVYIGAWRRSGTGRNADPLSTGLDRGYFLTKNQHGQCQTFDDGGDGYSRADANAFLHLKLLCDALRDGDEVRGVITAIGTNHSGKSHSITHPHAPTQARLFAANCQSARMDPRGVKLVEMHGTGTQAGDANEIQSVLAFARGRRANDSSLVIGSVKANLGHSEAASGCVALIKVLLCLEHRRAVPHIGIKGKLNTKFPPLDGVVIPTEPTALEVTAADGRIVACCNNFSAAGGNSSLFVHSPVPRAPMVEAQAGPQLVVLAGASPEAVKAYAGRLVAWTKTAEASLADIAYTLTATRPTLYRSRLAVVVDSVAALQDALGGDVAVSEPGAPPACALVFTGQGSHHVAMGQQLYTSNAVYRGAIDECRALLAARGFPDFHTAVQGSEAQAYDWQCAIFATEVALLRLWTALGLTPRLLGGHSLGEYAALHAAGVLSLADALFLVATRAQLMVQRCTLNASAMLAVHLSPEDATAALEGANLGDALEVACLNSPVDTVLAGPAASVKAAHDHLKAQRGVKCVLVDVPYAFHSAAVEPVMEAYGAAAAKVVFRSPHTDVLSNVHGRVVRAGEKGVFTADYLVQHMRQPVRFAESMAECLADGPLRWVEVGPHPVVTPMVKACLAAAGVEAAEPAVVPSMRKNSDAATTLLAAVAALYTEGHGVNFCALFDRSAVRALPLPFYAWQYENYWVPYTDRNLSTKLIEARGKAAPKSGKSAGAATGTRTDFALLTRCVQAASPTAHSARYTIDLTQSPCREIIQGHLVHGVCLMPASMYSDIALQAGVHVLESLGGRFDGETEALQVLDILMDEPVVLGVHDSLDVTATGLPSDAAGMQLSFAFPGGKRQGGCAVRVAGRGDVETRWSAIEDILARRITALTAASDGGARLTTAMAYRLFTKVVHYNDMYRAMQQVHLTDAGDEAALDVTLQHAPCLAGEQRRFIVFPVYQDSVGQCTGFLPNLQADADHVFVANGCKLIEYTARMAELAVQGSRLRVHCSMEEHDGQSTSDAYFFDDGGHIVGHMGGVRFRKIPLKVMTRLLPRPRAGRAAPSSAPHGQVSAAPPPAVAPAAAPRPAPAPPAPVLEAVPPPAPAATPAPTPAAPAAGAQGKLFAQLRSTIITELAVDEAELTPDRTLADLGLDSLMSLMILGSLQESVDVELPPSLFMDYPTLGAVQGYFTQRFGGEGEAASDQSSSGASSMAQSLVIDGSNASMTTHSPASPTIPTLLIDAAVVTLRPCKAGAEALAPLVLLPEGSGSPSVYADITSADPSLGGRRVFGVSFKAGEPGWTVDDLADAVTAALQTSLSGQRCILGGWSLGGVLAYLMSSRKQLDVAGIVLIDVPPAQPSLQPLPPALLDHLCAQASHQADSLRGAAQAGAGWSRSGIAKLLLPVLFIRANRAAAVPAVAPGSHWMVEDRAPGSSTGWEDAFANHVHVVDLRDADHFSIVKRPSSAQVAQAINVFLTMEV